MPRKNNRRASKSPIKNCPFPFKFAYECPEKWESLEPTDDPKIRYCHVCRHSVRMINTETEYNAAYGKNECVALEVIEKPKTGPIIMFGRPSEEPSPEEMEEINRRRKILKKARTHD